MVSHALTRLTTQATLKAVACYSNDNFVVLQPTKVEQVDFFYLFLLSMYVNNAKINIANSNIGVEVISIYREWVLLRFPILCIALTNW